MRGLGGTAASPYPSLLYQMQHPTSTVVVPITVLLYNGPLLCGFNVLIKALILSFISTAILSLNAKKQYDAFSEINLPIHMKPKDSDLQDDSGV